MTVKDKGKEQGKEKVAKKTERELIAKKEEDEGAAQVSRTRLPHFGLANKEFELRIGKSVPLRSRIEMQL
jgi:hypothetical protein